MKWLATLLITLSLSAGTAQAHPRIFRFVGKVERVDGTSLTIVTAKGHLEVFILNNETMFMRGDMPSAYRLIKAGEPIELRAIKRHKHLVASEVISR